MSRRPNPRSRRPRFFAVAIVVCAVAVIVGGTLAVAVLRRQRSSSPKVSLAGVLTMADATRASLEMEAPDGWVAAKTPFGSAQSVPDWYVCKTAHVEGTDSMCDAVLGRHFVGGFRRVDDPNSTLTVITLVGTSKDFDDGQSGTTFSVRDQDGSLIDDPSGNQRTLVWQEPSGLHVIMIATRGDQSPPLPTGDELGVIAANLQDGLRPLMAELPVEVATGDTSGSWVSGRGKWFAAVLVHGGDVCVQFGTRTSRGLIYDIRADLENACVSRRIGTVEATVRTVTDTPGHQQLRVMGTVPATAARARVLLSGGRIVEGSTASTDRGFAAFAFDIPAGWKPLRVLALDEKGNELSRGNVQIPRSLAGDFANAPVSLTEVARGKHDGTRWSLSVSPSSGGSIAMQYLEPLTEMTATVPVPNSAAPLSATFVRSFLAGATLPEAIRVHVESPDISPIDTPATSTDIGEGRGAALWILPLPDTTVERTLTITATDPNNRELAQTTLQQAPTAPATTTSTSQ